MNAIARDFERLDQLDVLARGQCPKAGEAPVGVGRGIAGPGQILVLAVTAQRAGVADTGRAGGTDVAGVDADEVHVGTELSGQPLAAAVVTARRHLGKWIASLWAGTTTIAFAKSWLGAVMPDR